MDPDNFRMSLKRGGGWVEGGTNNIKYLGMDPENFRKSLEGGEVGVNFELPFHTRQD